MPQNLSKDLNFSGMCIKDKKFPFIFINTRDGDSEPLIFETDGRKIFSLVSMVVCIGMNKFVLDMKNGYIKNKNLNKIYSIAGEVLITRTDLKPLVINNLDLVKKYATLFKVTPSMFLMRLLNAGRLSMKEVKDYRQTLIEEKKKVKVRPRSPLEINGYAKYNGERLSRETVTAHNDGRISSDEFKNLLFRRGRVHEGLFQEYSRKYK